MAEQPVNPSALLSEQPKPEEKKSGGLFVIKSSKSKEAPVPIVSPNEVSALSGRIRVIEERLYNLRRKTQLTDQNLLSHNKKVAREIKDLNADLKDLKLDLEDLRSVIQQIIIEMKKFANKNELDVLKKYVDLWEPLNFVTRAEVEKTIKETIQEIIEK